MKSSKRLECDIIVEKRKKEQMCDMPIWEKRCLTIEEAAVYSGIGRTKIREFMGKKKCPFVVWMDGTRFIIREKLEKFLEKQIRI